MWAKIISFFRRNKIELPPSTWDRASEVVDDMDAQFETVFGSQDYSGKPSRDWRGLYPKHEIQKWGDCVTFSRNNCAEVKAKEKGVVDDYGEEMNFSDLYLAVGSGTTENGNGLKNVAEFARKNGVVLEKDCPYTNDWGDRQNRFLQAKNKKRYKFGNWSWVIPGSQTTNRNVLKSALDKDIVQIGVGLGDTYRNGGVIKHPSQYTVYHAITLGYIDDKDQLYCLDHYNRREVVFDKNYPVIFAMSFADLPETWRGEGSEDLLFYQRMIGKMIIRPLAPDERGAAYRIFEDKIAKVHFNISDKQLFEETTDEYWRPKKKFLGVSEVDFARLKKIAFQVGEGIVEEPEIKGNLLNKLI